MASGEGRVTGHNRRGYELVAEWRDLEHSQSTSVERECIAWWRSQGWPRIDAAPKDGHTETTSSKHMAETLAWLNAFVVRDSSQVQGDIVQGAVRVVVVGHVTSQDRPDLTPAGPVT